LRRFFTMLTAVHPEAILLPEIMAHVRDICLSHRKIFFLRVAMHE